MKDRISHEGMDEILKKLEDDYIKAVKENESRSVEEFVEHFLYDSWTYNDENIQDIKTVLSRYSTGEVYSTTFIGAFNEMVDHLRAKLQELDTEQAYPALHNQHGASFLVAFVDGMVIQYFIGVYTVEQLREMTPYLKQVMLQALRTEAGGH
ncbi:hypothetical protein [Sinobaca sp. H24]|uniref:hypothetical protein n=1 Tax=Sinobaca sp. H24 TaxID=2923376 RepID=UPI00207A3221|nr:hypothetical protein [Sinobaca sp. H24]